MRYTKKVFKPIIAFSLIALLDAQSAFAQSGLTINSTNTNITNTLNVDTGSYLLTIDATQNLDITLNGGGDVALSKVKSAKSVTNGIVISGQGATDLKITSNSQQALVVDGDNFGIYDTLFENTSTATLTFGAGSSLVIGSGTTASSTSDFYGLRLETQRELLYRFGSGGVVFEQVGNQTKNTTTNGTGSNAIGIKAVNKSQLFGKLTFSRIVGGQGGDGGGRGGNAYGLTGTTSKSTLRIREGMVMIFDEIVGGDGGSSNGSITGNGGEAGGILVESSDFKIWTDAELFMNPIDNVGRIFFRSLKSGKSQGDVVGDVYPINNKGSGVLTLEGVSIIVGEDDESDRTNNYGIHNKIDNAQYNFGTKTILTGLNYEYKNSIDFEGLVLEKSTKISGVLEVRGGMSGRDWQGIGMNGASAIGLTLKNSKITASSGAKIRIAGGLAGAGDNKPNGTNGNATGVKSLENSSIAGDLALELMDVNEGSYRFNLDQFTMVDNYGVLILTPSSILNISFATSQLSRYKTPIAINNHDQITLSSGSAIRVGSGGDQITSGIYNNVSSKLIYNIGQIDIEGNGTQTSTTGFVTKSSVQINGADGVLNVYGGQDKPVAGLAFVGGISNASEVVANIYGTQGKPIIGLVLGGSAELDASNMTLNLTTKQNARTSRSGEDYLAGIVLGDGSAKIKSGIYTFNFLNEESVGDRLFAIKNLSTDGSLTLSSQAFVPLGVDNPSEITQTSIFYDSVGYNYEFGNGNAKTILDAGYLPNGLLFTKTIYASGNLEIKGNDDRINAFTSRTKDPIGIVSSTALSISVSGRQAEADNGADAGRSVGVNIAQGEFFLQGNNGGKISFNINGGENKEATGFVGEAVGVLISGDAFSADEFSNFKVVGGEAYGIRLVGSAIHSRQITLNLNEANFSGNDISEGAIVGSITSYGIHNQGNTTLAGNIIFGDGSHVSIGSSTTQQAYGLYNQSGTLSIAGTLQFKADSILAKTDGESGVIYNAGEIVFAKQSSLVFGNTFDSGVQGNLKVNDAYMKIKMLEGSSMLFSDVAFSTSGGGKIDIDMGYDPATNKGAKLLFEDNAGDLNVLQGKYAQISLAGANQTSIDTRKTEIFSPRTLKIADMQLDKSSFILFASSKDSLNQSDQIIVTDSTLSQDSLVDNSLHVVLGDFKQEAQTPTVLAEVKSSAKDRVIFNGLSQDGEKVNTTTYSGFDTAVIEVERVSDTDGNAIYQSTLEIKEQAVNEDYINPTAAVLSTNFNLFSANLNSLNKRMGELRDNPFTHGVWARVFVGKQSSDFGVEATSIYTTAQMGYDYKFRLSDSSNYVGLALSYINSTTNQAVSRYRIDTLGNVMLGISSATTNGVEVALYNSYIADNGFYSDSLIKLSYLLSDVNMFEQNHNYTTKNIGFSLSQEVGYRFRIGGNTEWMIDPQIELSYGYFNAEDFVQVLDGITQSYLDSRQDAVSLLRSRIGVAWGYDFSHLIKKEGYKTSAYLGTYYAYDYLAGGDVSYLTNNNSQASYQAMKSNGRFVLNVGVNAELDKKTRIYFDFEKSFGNVMQIDYQFNFGVRIGLGDDEIKEENQNKEKQVMILKPTTLQSEQENKERQNP